MQYDLGQMPGQQQSQGIGQSPAQAAAQAGAQPSTGQWQGLIPPSSPEAIQVANVANVLLLIGSVVVVVTTKDKPLIASAYVKLIAGFMFIYASFREAQVQQIAPGVTTKANRLKISGSIISIIGALLLTQALLIEAQIRSEAGNVTTPTISPSIAGTGAFTIG